MSTICNETFLDDVVRLQVFSAADFTAPMPPTLPSIVSMVVTEGTAVLDVSFTSAPIIAKEGGISVKQTQRKSGSQLLYIYNVDANIEAGVKELADLSPALAQEDHHVIITKQDGTRYLLYALPGTFNADAQNALTNGTFKASLTSLNNYVSI